jgi:RsiW-degrading membrane proteinase PrsW (M82 family)
MPLNDGSLLCQISLLSQWILTPGFIEEGSKALWLVVGLWFRKIPKTPTALALCGMSLGAGFETAENIRYAFPTGLDFTRCNPSRAIAALNRALASYMHVAWTGAVAAGIAEGSGGHAILKVILLHGLYDYGASLSLGVTYTNSFLAKLISIPCVWLSVAQLKEFNV